MQRESGVPTDFLANLEGVRKRTMTLGGHLVAAAAVTLLVAACEPRDERLVGTQSELFLAALNPSARECVSNALPKERLESALAALATLPHSGPLVLHDLEQLGTCAGPVEVRQGIARVVLASLPDKAPRLMLEQADTPEDVSEVERRFAHFPRKLAGRHRAQGFERRGPARFGVAYGLIEVPETPQTLIIDDLTRPGQHPPGWTAGELVAYTALEAGDRLIAAGVHHGVAWARIIEAVDGGAQQVITWGDIDGKLLYRAAGASREVLAALLEAFRASASM